MVKVGVIGAGYWGRKHVEEFVAIGTDVVVADISKENLEQCKSRYGIKTTENYREILADKGVAGVTIVTPNRLHYSMCKEALLSNKHVLVEKPLAMSVAECDELITIATETNKILAVGHVFRFNNAVRKIKELVEMNELGKIRICKLRWINFNELFEDRDVIFDLAPHPLDIINFIFGKDPTEVSCVGGAFRRGKGAEAAFVNCRINDIIINMEISWLTPQKERSIMLIGSKKTAFVDCTAQKIKLFDNATAAYSDLLVTPNNTIRCELEHFIYCMENNVASIADGISGAKTIRMIEIINKSMQEKRTFAID